MVSSIKSWIFWKWGKKMHSPLPMARQKQESIKACYPWPTEINKLFQHLVRTLKSDSELSFTCVALFFFSLLCICSGWYTSCSHRNPSSRQLIHFSNNSKLPIFFKMAWNIAKKRIQMNSCKIMQDFNFNLNERFQIR